MRNSNRINRAAMTGLLAIIVLLALPAISFAQGRGHGRGRGRDMSWKCGKFVNCHDARDGRLDGRGPRGVRIGHRARFDSLLFPHRARRVNRGNVIFVPRNRVRFDRDGDGDFDRFDVRRGRRSERFERRHGRH